MTESWNEMTAFEGNNRVDDSDSNFTCSTGLCGRVDHGVVPWRSRLRPSPASSRSEIKSNAGGGRDAAQATNQKLNYQLKKFRQPAPTLSSSVYQSAFDSSRESDTPEVESVLTALAVYKQRNHYVTMMFLDLVTFQNFMHHIITKIGRSNDYLSRVEAPVIVSRSGKAYLKTPASQPSPGNNSLSMGSCAPHCSSHPERLPVNTVWPLSDNPHLFLCHIWYDPGQDHFKPDEPELGFSNTYCCG
ncbi:hypothetical protein EV424DRAFT_1347252 [Suillus variegatus]|nr:hypothetical protein EV424DRAFT_1347252 [Suillus variegatus]